MRLPRKTREQLRRILELRRSNASVPIRNKKRYTRRIKHRDKDLNGE